MQHFHVGVAGLKEYTAATQAFAAAMNADENGVGRAAAIIKSLIGGAKLV